MRRLVWFDALYIKKLLAVLVDGAANDVAAIAEASARVDDELELSDGLPELAGVHFRRCESVEEKTAWGSEENSPGAAQSCRSGR